MRVLKEYAPLLSAFALTVGLIITGIAFLMGFAADFGAMGERVAHLEIQVAESRSDILNAIEQGQAETRQAISGHIHDSKTGEVYVQAE